MLAAGPTGTTSPSYTLCAGHDALGLSCEATRTTASSNINHGRHLKRSAAAPHTPWSTTFRTYVHNQGWCCIKQESLQVSPTVGMAVMGAAQGACMWSPLPGCNPTSLFGVLQLQVIVAATAAAAVAVTFVTQHNEFQPASTLVPHPSQSTNL